MSEEKRRQSDWWRMSPDMAWQYGMMLFIIVMWTIASTLSLLSRAHSEGDRTLLVAALVLGFIGIVLLFLARLPLYRKRRLFTFGPHALDRKHQRLYWWAYGFIGVSLLLLVLILCGLKAVA